MNLKLLQNPSISPLFTEKEECEQKVGFNLVKCFTSAVFRVSMIFFPFIFCISRFWNKTMFGMTIPCKWSDIEHTRVVAVIYDDFFSFGESKDNLHLPVSLISGRIWLQKGRRLTNEKDCEDVIRTPASDHLLLDSHYRMFLFLTRFHSVVQDRTWITVSPIRGNFLYSPSNCWYYKHFLDVLSFFSGLYQCIPNSRHDAWRKNTALWLAPVLIWPNVFRMIFLIFKISF